MHKLFGEILIENGKITKEQLEEGLKLQKDNPARKLGEILVTMNYINSKDIEETLIEQYKMDGKKPAGIEKWLSQDEIDRILSQIK